MKHEWYYEYCSLDVTSWRTHDAELYLIRLTVFDDGSAELLFPSGNVEKYANEDDAEWWLAQEEFGPLETLFEEFAEEGIPADPLIQYPDEGSRESMLKGMRVPLPKLT